MYVLDTNTLSYFFKGLGHGEDILIAGTALSQRGILVTHNTREFGRVPGLALEDWY